MRMSFFRYKVYDFTIKSMLELPELPQSIEPAEVYIRRGSVNWRPPFLEWDRTFLEANLAETLLYWDGVGSCCISEGREIIIDPLADADEQSLRLFVLNAALTVLVQQRGYLVLHGSAVVIAGGVVVFLGVSGQGKSTLAAALHQRGYSVVADDIVVIDSQASRHIVLPGFPRLRLLPDATVALGYHAQTVPVFHSWIQKHELLVDQDFIGTPLPLKCIYELNSDDTLDSIELTSQSAFLALTHHYHNYGVRWIQATHSEKYLLQCSQLVGSVPIRRLRAASGFTDISRIVRIVEEQAING